MRLATLVLAVGLLAMPARGAAGEFNFTPYVWIPGINGTIGTGTGGSGADVSLGDRVSVDFSPEFRIGGAMLNFSWREDRFTVFGDWTYANVRATSPSPFGALYSEVSGQILGNVGQLFTGYMVYDDSRVKLDTFLGGRVYAITGRLGLEAGRAPKADLESSSVWMDVATGIRFNAVVYGNWRAHLRADVGAGGSHLTWQAYGVAGYQVSDMVTIVAGWRHLYIDRRDGDLKAKLSLSGPVIGAAIVF